MNHITVELCQEDRARIDKVIDLLTLSTGQRCQSCAEAVATMCTASQPSPVQDAPAPVEFTKDTPEEETPAEITQEGDTAPQVSRADVQKKVIDLSAAGKKAEVREIVTAVATKVSDIPEDKLAEVWDKLNKLEG